MTVRLAEAPATTSEPPQANPAGETPCAPGNGPPPAFCGISEESAPSKANLRSEPLGGSTMKPLALTVPLALLPCLLPAADGERSVTDDFSSYADGSDGSPTWQSDSIFWEVRDGAYQFQGGAPGFAMLAGDDLYREATVEATITLHESQGESWKVAGVAVYADAANYWHLALVEAPAEEDGRHFVELSEMLGGQWLSQQSLQGTVRESHIDPAWDYGTPYRLRIEMNSEGIVGTVSSLNGELLHKIGYGFTAAAVTSGRAALRTSRFDGAFDDVEVALSGAEAPKGKPERPRFSVDTAEEVIGEATGFYHVKQIEGTWWVVDPKGRKFYAIGTDHCRYRGHWCEELGYAPYGRNMEAKFGSPEAWAEPATDRLKSWNFNLLGAGGGSECFYRGLAHTAFAAFGSTFSDVSDICPKVHWTGFPNVFHPKWEGYCDKLAQRQCEPSRDDPWLFGYFLDNELEWYGKTHTQWGLFDETMKKPADHSGKIALVDFLKRRYKSINRFGEVWGLEVESFDGLLEMETLPDGGKESLRKVKIDFVRLVADRYFAVTTAAIRKHDPNHMVIGCRFAGDAPAGIWDIAGKYCDIVTFNYYGRVDLEAEEAPGLAERFTSYYEQAERPLMITEWSFPALDSGLPCKHGAGQRFDTQEQKAKAYDIFQTMVLSLPFMVGSDYFMWVDEPALGISSTFPEDSNYGLVNVDDEPYVELTETATRVNGQAYELHAEGIADLSVAELERRDDGYFVAIANRGRKEATADLELTVDGDAETRVVTVPGRGRETVRVSRTWTPGGHLIVAQIDPERKLSQVSRSDDRADLAFYKPGAEWPEWAKEGARRIPVAIANPSDEALTHFPVAIRLGKLADLSWEEIDWSQIYVDGLEEWGFPDTQIDPHREPLTAESELCFLVRELPAGACRTAFVTIQPLRQERREAPCPVSFEQTDAGFVAKTALHGEAPLELRKSKPGGDIIDEIIVDGVPLGRYNPLIWQDPGQNQWVQPTRFESVEASRGPVRMVLRLTATYGADGGGVITTVDDEGQQEARAQTPVPFRVTHKVILYPDRSDFQARFVSIENLGDRPLQLKGYFFYLLSAIGADPAGDTTASPDVPNYYAGGDGAWRDEEAGAIFGAESWPGSDLQVRFWLDEGGGQHPDARRQLEPPVLLAPGEVYAEPDAPPLTVYGASADGSPWREVQERLERWAAVLVEPGPVERR
jgi:hypothetical protein